MSVLRQSNLLGQQRVDVPHVRALESSICADFDLLAGRVMAGLNAMIVSGFEVVMTGAVGASATALQIKTASSVLLHPLASESGTIFSVPSDRAVEILNSSNARLNGSFTANATNYVGIDLARSPDTTTSDTVQFLDPNTGLETPKSVPLGRTLDYVIVVSTQDFAANLGVAPIAKVVTDANNVVTSVTDARQRMFRLGSGGSVPNIYNSYPWPGGRTEPTTNDNFTAGDRSIASMKDWVDSIMTRLWEIGGGEFWYSSTADRNVRMTRAGTTFTNGEWFEWTGTNLHWRGLKFVFSNSTAYYNDVKDQTADSAGLTDLADGYCVYVDLDRTTNRTGGTALQPVKALTASIGTPSTPGSRYVIAWRVGSNIYTRDSSFPVGATFNVATNTSLGIVQLSYAAGTPATPIVVPLDGTGQVVNTSSAGIGFVGTGAAGFVGLKGTGGTNAAGVNGIGTGTGAGVTGTGGATSGVGVSGTGTAGGAGVTGTGGAAGNGTGVIGTGGGSGIGVSGSAPGAGAGGYFSSVSGPGLQAKVGGSSTTAMEALDLNSNRRWFVDTNGFAMPRTSFVHEEWWVLADTSTAALNSGAVADLPGCGGKWRYVGNGAAATQVSSLMDSTLQANGLNVTCAATTGFYNNVHSRSYVVYPTSTAIIEAQWEMKISSSGANNVSYIVGFGDGLITQASLSTNRLWFRLDSGDAFWQMQGTGAKSAHTVAPNAGAWHKFRIEFHGAATPIGVANGSVAVGFFFIDGTVAGILANLPTSPMGFVIAMESTGNTAGANTLVVGPLDIQWNRNAAVAVPNY